LLANVSGQVLTSIAISAYLDNIRCHMAPQPTMTERWLKRKLPYRYSILSCHSVYLEHSIC